MVGVRGLLIGILALVLGAMPLRAETARRPLATNQLRAAVADGRALRIGRLPATRVLHLAIALPLRDPAGLAAFLADITNPKSPNFRHYLTVADFTRRFGPSEADYRALVDFAAAHRLRLTATAPNRMMIEVDGTVADIEGAFQVTLGLYRHPTEPRVFYAPDRAPSADLAVPIWHVDGLDDYSVPRPNLVTRPAAETTPAGGSGPSGTYLGKDMRQAYYGGTALTGAGQTVGLFEFAGYWIGDVENYFTTTGQPDTVPVNDVLIGGARNCSSPCQDAEQAADIVQSIGMAPGLSQVLVYIGSLDSAILNRIASDDVAKQISISWAWDPADPASDDPYFEEMAAQGQSVFVATGDCGSYVASASPNGCSNGAGIFAPQYPPEDTNVTAVGGTVLSMTGYGAAYQGETAWRGSGGGYASTPFGLPGWQSGLATVANGASTTLRNLPDVAIDGNTDSYYCEDGVCDPGNSTAGGTSLSAPRWAAFMALVNQQAAEQGKPAIGFLNPTLYALLRTGSAAGAVHDITVGSNAGFFAVPGYDLVTGWGSPNGQSFIDALVGAGSGGSPLAAAILPGSRAVEAGSPATVFATMLNAGGAALSGCAPALPSSAPAGLTLDYRPTDAATNQPSGAEDVPVPIGAGGSQSFVLAFGDASPAAVTALPVAFGCAGAQPAPSATGVNTVDLLFSAAPVADIIALAATATNDGTVHIANGAGAFAVATIDAGAAGTVTATLDTGGATLPLAAALCQTDAGGQCLAPPATSLTVSFAANATPTFSVFLGASAPIAFAPATARVFLRFTGSDGLPHGSTSVAVTTQ